MMDEVHHLDCGLDIRDTTIQRAAFRYDNDESLYDHNE
jgi:hypothetical protein